MTELPYQKTATYEELLEDILLQIVEYPDDLVVSEKEDPDYLRLIIKANKFDYGKIIGKQGSTIGAIHKLFVSITCGHQVKIDVKDD
jgi:predicted RNA-binding protein YlqC (UPF0109 family)